MSQEIKMLDGGFWCPPGWRMSRSNKIKYKGKCVKKAYGQILKHTITHIPSSKRRSYHRRIRSGRYKGRHVSSLLKSSSRSRQVAR